MIEPGPGEHRGGRIRRWLSRLSVRLLAFNLLLVLVPLGGAFYLGLHELLGRYERQLLEAQERSMAQQGRLLAAALAESSAASAPMGEGGEAARAPALGAEGAAQILAGLEQRLTARLRVWDGDGRLVADSSRLGPTREELEASRLAAGEFGPAGGGAAADRERWLYRLGAAPFRLGRRLLGGSWPAAAPDSLPDPGPGPEPAAAQPEVPAEVRSALAGRYGAAVRPTPGEERSLTLHVGIPVRIGERVVGAVQASQSTFRILEELRGTRLAFFQVLLASVAVAVVLSLALATTISRPVRRLRAEAAALVDRRGRLRGTFTGSDHLDEIGDLARALEGLSRRVEEHGRFAEAFAADLSHEFRNPLTSIRAATEVLSETDDPGERVRLLATVESEVARLEGLLFAVREMSWIDSRLDEEPTGPQDLGALLGALVENLRLRVPGAVRVELHLPEEPIAVRGAPDRLVQVLENLLDNALGFAPIGSAVVVRLERDGDQGVVTVADQGPGIPREHLERIFDRFFTYRSDPPGEGSRRHAGLGLAIVRAIAEGYGGSVRAANAAAGGALFELRLPLAAVPG
jgi:two-component system, OmpR family, sensor histidine kinase ChvG